MWEQNQPVKAKGRRGRPERFAPEQVIHALLMERGYVSGAARRLGCSRKTIHNYIKRHPVVAEMLEDYHGVRLDRYELALERKAQKGSVKAMIAILGTHGRHRGWGGISEPGDTPNSSHARYHRGGDTARERARQERILEERQSAIREFTEWSRQCDEVYRATMGQA